MQGRPGYGGSVDRRWKVLLAISATVLVADQVTKLLAVEHLTPGIADAALEDRRVRSREDQATVLDAVGFGQKVSLFFGAVENPCRYNGRMCPEVKVFDGFWSWRYAENRGAAWSMFAKLGDAFRLPFLVGVALLAVVFILGYVKKLEPGQDLLLVALSMVLGGAIGNLVDRVNFGYVVDFIVWYYDGFYWPTFNVADVGISVGVGLILLSSLLEMLQKRGEPEAETGVAQH